MNHNTTTTDIGCLPPIKSTTSTTSSRVGGYTIEDARRFLAEGRPTTEGKAAAPKGRDHAYAPSVAKDYGIPAAIVLRYLSFCASKSRRIEHGIQWFRKSIADIARLYPYLSASTVHAALKGIPENLLMRQRRKDRRTRAISTDYAFCDPAFEARVNSWPIFFDPNIAQRFGIHAAVVLHYVQHCINLCREKQPEYRFHPISPKEVGQKLGISRASINRALSALVEGGMLDRNPKPSGRFPEYGGLSSPGPSGASLNSGNDALKLG